MIETAPFYCGSCPTPCMCLESNKCAASESKLDGGDDFSQPHFSRIDSGATAREAG